MSETQNILDKIKEKGLRLTKAREEIISFLLNREIPATAVEIKAALVKKGFKLNKTTVYRNLETLLKLELIQEVYLNDRETRYELVSEESHHHHLFCENCKRIVHLENKLIEKKLSQIEAKLESHTNFEIESHSLEFFGKCKQCK